VRDGKPIVAISATGDDGSNSTVLSYSTGAVYVYGVDTAQSFTAPTVLRDQNELAYAYFGVDLAFDETCSRLGVGSYGRP
jgi:hypothetical protein